MRTDPPREEFAHSLAGALVNTQYTLPTPSQPARPRHCLVTVGATAPFTSLVAAAFDPTFLGALINAGFTKLMIQAGKDADLVQLAARMFGHPTLKIECFDFVDDLRSVMVMCGKGDGERETGVVICHAGEFTSLYSLVYSWLLSRVAHTYRHRDGIGRHDLKCPPYRYPQPRLAGQPPA